jgi:hypothetical protein
MAKIVPADVQWAEEISFHIVSDRGNESGGADGFFHIDFSSVVGVFAVLDLLQYLINHSRDYSISKALKR